MTKVLQINSGMPGLGYADIPRETISVLVAYNLIPQLLSQRVIESAMSTTGYANAPITCTPAETSHSLEQFYQHWDLTTQETRQDWCLRYCLNQEQLELLATRKLRVEKFKQITWGHQIESYFLQRKRYLDRVIYSLIQTDNKSIANELFFRIAEAESSFAELAREYSQGSEADRCGIIGPVEFGSMTPNFAQLLYTSQVGVVQPPVAFGNSWVIVRVEKIISAQLDDFMRQRLLQEKFEDWFQQQLYQLSPEEQIWMGINSKSAQL